MTTFKKRVKKEKNVVDDKTTDTTKTDETLYNQHKNFRDQMSEQNQNPTPEKTTGKNEVELESLGKINLDEEPFARETIQRDYTDAGINSNKAASNTQANANTNASDKTDPNINQSEPSPPSGDDFGSEPSPPNPQDDPSYAGEFQPGGENGEQTSPFNIPTGSANDLVDFGAQSLNYAIGIFGPMLVGIKIHKEFYNYSGIVDDIKEQNDKNTERIKFDNEDIEMLRKPLVAMMQEKGIRGLTNGEQLLVALLLIASKKAKLVVEIRRENKILESKLLSKIRSQNPTAASTTSTETTTDNEKIEVVVAEELA